MREVVRRYPVVTYFVLAYAITWAMFPLIAISISFGFVALFGPALAAVITAAILGEGAVRALFARFGIGGFRAWWFGVALLLPPLVALIGSAISLALGSTQTPLQWTLITVILSLLIIGEELGWRGFALPRLLERHSPLVASLILGAVWTCWHLPNFLLPSLPQYGQTFPGFALWVISLTVVFTWVFRHTQGNLTAAWILHAAANFPAILNVDQDPNMFRWISAGVYAVVAIVIVLMERDWWFRRPTG